MNACEIYKKNYKVACFNNPEQISTELRLRFASAIRQSAACKDVTVSDEPLGQQNMKAFEDGWSLSFNVGIDGGDIDYSNSQWQIIDNKTKKRFGEGPLKDAVEAATRICTVATGQGGSVSQSSLALSEPTKIVAWWGAILSTIVFLWDIYKHRTAGPRLRFTAQPGMETLNLPMYEGMTVILANVTNYGDRSTTITNLGYLYFKGRQFFRKKMSDKAAIVPNPSAALPLPFELKPGVVWMGIAIQDPQIEEWATTGILDMMLYHSHSQKPLRRRVVIRKKKN
jgi:hypothetical protein